MINYWREFPRTHTTCPLVVQEPPGFSRRALYVRDRRRTELDRGNLEASDYRRDTRE